MAYNGWVNWETWNAYTALTSEYEVYDDIRNLVDYQEKCDTKPDEQKVEDFTTDIKKYLAARYGDRGKRIPLYVIDSATSEDIVWRDVYNALIEK